MQNLLNFDENLNHMEETKQPELINTSDKIKQAQQREQLSLHQKLHKAKLAIGKVVKNAQSHHSKYADLNAIMDVVEPILLENGLLLLQPIQGQQVCTQIIDIESGASVDSCIDLPTNTTPQTMGSAITYYRRYTLQACLSLQAVDDDGQAASKEQPTETKKESLSDARFKAALESITKGEFTVDQLKAKFYLTKEQEAQL